MFKATAILATSVLLSVTAFAQQGTQNASFDKVKSNRNDFIANGFMVGAAYEHLGTEGSLKLKDRSTGVSTTVSVNSDSNTDLAGVKIAYAKMPKNDWGLNMGFTPLKVNQSNSDNKTYYLLRGEGNVTLATPINDKLAIYGFGGGSISHLTDNSNYVPLAFGIQAGAGLSISSQISLEAGYSYTMMRPKASALDSSTLALDEDNSYVSLKGLSTRLTYNF